MSDLKLIAGFNKPSTDQIPEGWCIDQLGNTSSVMQGGKLGMTKESHYITNGIPAFSAAGQDGFVEISEYQEIDGVVLSSIGAKCGKCFYAEGDWTTLANTQALIPNNRMNAKFLYYRINREDYWTRSGSAQPFIKPSDIKHSWIAFPNDIYEQKKIVTILSTIDQTIERTEALIEKYQQIKAGMMSDLFTRGVFSDGSLRPTRDEAPELYQKTPIGWIPKGWEHSMLKNHLTDSPKNGYSPREIDEWEGVYVLGLGCLTKQGFKPLQLKNAPKSSLLNSVKLQEGDFLISRANTPGLVGLCGIYEDTSENTIYPDLMMRLRLSNTLDANFLEYFLLYPLTRNRLTSLAVGTSGSMVKLNANAIKSFLITVPRIDEQLFINIKLKPIVEHLKIHETYLSKLKLLKSGLMHDLLTGKVRVTTTERES